MNDLILFTDGSVHVRSKIGYGAYLAILDQNLSPDSLKNLVKVKRFEDTSSVRIELETLVWALHEIGKIENTLVVYTDSQNILSLPERRSHFETNEYRTKKGHLISNHELYKEFYILTSKLKIRLIKVQGHKQSDQKDQTDRLFSLVDKASRNALRKNMSELAQDG